MGRTASPVLSHNNFAIKAASLNKMAGMSRTDLFYRCAYDFDEIKEATDVDSYLRAAVRKYSELFFKSGYVFQGGDEQIKYLNQRLRLMSFMNNEPFDELLRGTARDLVMFSNAFWIKTRQSDKINKFGLKAKGITSIGDPVVGYSRVDPSDMLLKFDDKKGELIGYKQVTNLGKEKEFSVDDVIHFTFDKGPGSYWGAPRWLAVLEDIRTLRKIEGDVLALMYRYSMPLYQAQVGLTQQGMGGTEKEVNDTRDEIERTPTDGMLVTTERVNLKVIGADGSALDVSPYLEYFKKRAFSGLNVSEAMMEGTGSSQNADSMEEQVHNAVKDNQANFAVQFEHEVLTELLLEGGFNPILDDEDIVHFKFNEINLDTKIKTENHVINQYQTNLITFEEARKMIGYKDTGIDKTHLYSNYIEQENTLEQIDKNHENAMELARLTAQLNQENTQDTSKSSGSNTYTKKNTGNGKNVRSGKTNKQVSSTDAPSNQYGTYSVKVKESVVPISASIEHLTKDICDNIDDLMPVKNKLEILIDDTMHTFAENGWKKALEDLGTEEGLPDLIPVSEQVSNFARKSISEYFVDIKELGGNTTSRDGFENKVASQNYRLNFLNDFVARKSFWYSYAKACSLHGIKELVVSCDENSKHHARHGNIINTNNFSLSDIPGYSSGCQCKLKPKEKG